ncbi:MAG TPA: outer membrane protein assembly factor BamE [Methylotenera sp.]|nr:outer membrane protein assembly factor BamE [Methylotenera sp.]
MRYSFVILALLCASCGTALPTIKPYKLDVQQGNVVTSKMLLQLRPGMTKSQVRFIMGTPLIQDSFHDKRWDYVYQLRENGKITEQRRVILDFENELLKSVRGDVVPTGSDTLKVKEDTANTGTRVINPAAKPADKGLMDKLKFWEKDDPALAKEAEAAKAKAAADEAAKNTANSPSENAVTKDSTPPQDSVSPSEENKSMLAVPLEAMPMTDTPVAAPVTEKPAPAAPAEAASIVVEPAIVEPPSIEKNAEPIKAEPANIEPKTESVPETAPVLEEVKPRPAPITPPPYDSSSGMVFDKSLKPTPEEALDVKPKAAAPRGSNKTAPKPKELPEEEPLGYFDQILEKIGF